MFVSSTPPISVEPTTLKTKREDLRTEREEQEDLPRHIAKKIRVEHKKHGDVRVDNYHWLRGKTSPEAVAFFEAWNTYTKRYFDSIRPLSEKLYEEFVSRIEPNDKSVPFKLGLYMYYTRMEEGKECPIYCRTKVGENTEEIVIDGNKCAEGETYFKVQAYKPSPDGLFVAFMIDTTGTQYGKIWIKNMVKGTFLNEEVIDKSDGGMEWNSQSTGLWYTQINDELRTDKVRFHVIGSAVSSDPLIVEEKDALFDLGVAKDKLDRYMIIQSTSIDTVDAGICPLDNPRASLTTIQPKEEGLMIYIIAGKEQHYMMVAKDRSCWSLYRTEDSKWAQENWQLIVEAIPSQDLVNVEVFQDHFALIKRVEDFPQIEVHSLEDGSVHKIPLPQEICEVEFSHNEEYATPWLRFVLTFSVTPDSTYRYNMETRKLELLKQRKAGDFDPTLYTTEKVWAVANDGTKVPISLCYKKGIVRDGNAPLHLHAYGAYGFTVDPFFSNIIASYLERGVIYGVAHVRGGGDLGRKWYKEGCLLKKRNTFTDFINCAEYLIKEGYTSSDRLVISGDSAGGLLMGAVLNMRSDLFKACLALAPFVDVITTMLDESVPLTTEERLEWGNPNNLEYYHYMKSYSPVDNVIAQDYPALLVTAGINDAQVPVHEPAKWVAKLSEFKTDSNPLLFQVNMGAGHHGASGRYAVYEECAPYHAFLLNQLGYSASDVFLRSRSGCSLSSNSLWRFGARSQQNRFRTCHLL